MFDVVWLSGDVVETQCKLWGHKEEREKKFYKHRRRVRSSIIKN